MRFGGKEPPATMPGNQVGGATTITAQTSQLETRWAGQQQLQQQILFISAFEGTQGRCTI